MLKISLDRTALNELFPEGSEERLQLVDAVKANFIRDLMINYKSDLVKDVISELQKVRTEILNETISKFKTIDSLIPVHRQQLKTEYEAVAKKYSDECKKEFEAYCLNQLRETTNKHKQLVDERFPFLIQHYMNTQSEYIFEDAFKETIRTVKSDVLASTVENLQKAIIENKNKE